MLVEMYFSFTQVIKFYGSWGAVVLKIWRKEEAAFRQKKTNRQIHI